MTPWLFLCCVLLISPASASDRSDLIDNFETVAGTQLPGAKIERKTVHRAKDGAWLALADLEGGSKVAVIKADFAGDDWTAQELERLSPAAAAKQRLEFSRAATQQTSWQTSAGRASEEPSDADPGEAAGPPRRRPTMRVTRVVRSGRDAQRSFGARRTFGRMPEVTLYPANGGGTFLPDCGTDKCLTIIVAPWCPHCRAATSAIQNLRDDMENKGIETRIVVSQDSAANCQEYAADFGRDTLLDPAGNARAGAIPKLWLSDKDGAIIGQMAGMNPDETPAQAEAELGLQ